MSAFLDKKNIDMLTSLKVFSETEIKSRYEIQLENYCKTVNIEACTMIDMAEKEILPAVCEYEKDLCETVSAKTAAVEGLKCRYEKGVISSLSELTDSIADAVEELKSSVGEYEKIDDITKASTRRKRLRQINTGRSRPTATSFSELSKGKERIK